MKSFSVSSFFSALALITLSSAPALAYPALHDYAKLSGTISNGTQSFPASFELEITDYNASSGQYKVKNTANMGGQVQSQENWAQDMVTQDMVLDLLANCKANGGKLEDTKVAAGTFKTCALTSENADQIETDWVGDVTFGLVKVDVYTKQNGVTTHVELEAHRPGK